MPDVEVGLIPGVPSAGRDGRAATVVVQGVSVPDAEVGPTLGTRHRQQLLPLAALSRAAERENLLPTLPRARPAASIHVLADHHIRHLPPSHWDRDVAKWTHRDTDILLEGQGAAVCSACDMVFTEVSVALAAPQREEVQPPARLLGAVLPQVRELHGQRTAGPDVTWAATGAGVKARRAGTGVCAHPPPGAAPRT